MAGTFQVPVLANGALCIAGYIYAYSLEPATGKLRWLNEIPGAVSSAPVIADGALYVAAEHWDEQTPKNGMILALDSSTGNLRWRYDIPGELWADPVLEGGVIYMGSIQGQMYALDADTGNLRWSFAARDAIRRRATVENGTVYFGSVDRNVYALDATTGDLLWRYQTDGPLWAGPVVASGLIYVGVGVRHLHALDAGAGTLRWQYESPVERLSLPVVAHGVVYVSASKNFSEAYQQGQNIEGILHYGYVTALDARTGRQIWEYRTAGDPSRPVLADGVVYVSAGDERSYLLRDPPESVNPAMRGRVYALDAATGVLIFQRRIVAEVGAGPEGPSVVDGTVYVLSSEQLRYGGPGNLPTEIHGQLSAFDSRTGESRWLFGTDDQFPGPLTVVEGVAYIASYNGQVHALRSPNGP